MSMVSLLLAPAALLLLGYAAFPLRRRATPLSRVTVAGDEVVADVYAPVFLAFRRRLRAPLSSVRGARVLPAGVRPRMSMRVAGAGLPGLYLGWFWKRGLGLCFLVYRPTRDAVEIDLADGRAKRWVVETPDPAEVVAALSRVSAPV